MNTKPRKIIKKNQLPFRKKVSSKSKKTFILFIIGIIAIVLIIPTSIVLPFIKKDTLPSESNASPSNEKAEEMNSDYMVAVKRASTDTVENLPLETYVVGVVASEMPIEFEMEALKAQAVAARTYVVNHLLHESKDKTITDTVQHQVYKNDEELRQLWGKDYEDKMNRLMEAVQATQGQVILHGETPITPAFFSTSNGFTENSEDYWGSELPYLRSVESPWDKNSPKFLDQKTFSLTEIEDHLQITLPREEAVAVGITRTDSERVKELTLQDHTFSGREIREKLGLRSNDFSIKQRNDHLIFTTKGYGHGIGMSQYGANELAKQGKTYEDIIHYYYKDVQMKPVNHFAPTLVRASEN